MRPKDIKQGKASNIYSLLFSDIHADVVFTLLINGKMLTFVDILIFLSSYLLAF